MEDSYIHQGLRKKLIEKLVYRGIRDEKVLSAIQDHVDQSNSKVANVQQIKKFTLLSNEWTDSSGELTPSLKLKRHVVTERYENEIEAMYEEAK